jgi:hypothetical protein
MPALPPMTTTVWPISSDSRWVDTVVAVRFQAGQHYPGRDAGRLIGGDICILAAAGAYSCA